MGYWDEYFFFRSFIARSRLKLSSCILDFEVWDEDFCLRHAALILTTPGQLPR
jgi:hypothetical protein